MDRHSTLFQSTYPSGMAEWELSVVVTHFGLLYPGHLVLFRCGVEFCCGYKLPPRTESSICGCRVLAASCSVRLVNRRRDGVGRAALPRLPLLLVPSSLDVSGSLIFDLVCSMPWHPPYLWYFMNCIAAHCSWHSEAHGWGGLVQLQEGLYGTGRTDSWWLQ